MTQLPKTVGLLSWRQLGFLLPRLIRTISSYQFRETPVQNTDYRTTYLVHRCDGRIAACIPRGRRIGTSPVNWHTRAHNLRDCHGIRRYLQQQPCKFNFNWLFHLTFHKWVPAIKQGVRKTADKPRHTLLIKSTLICFHWY